MTLSEEMGAVRRGEAAPTQTRLGAWMRVQRERLVLTRKHVANAVGVARNTVCEWEQGKRVPTLANFIAWCRSVCIEPAAAIVSVELLVGG